jgi:hypothetical protein
LLPLSSLLRWQKGGKWQQRVESLYWRLLDLSYIHDLSNTSIALNAVYPEYNLSAPIRKPKGHWNDILNQRIFLDQLAEKLKVKKPEDWYNVTVNTVLQHGGSFVKTNYNTSLVRGKEGNIRD